MWDSFNTAFEGNIEKLKITHPHMDYEEMVKKAAEITTSFFYFLERENLESYRKPEFWSDLI